MKKLALVTGGIKGIGKATALRLKGSGYSVVVSYRGDDDCARMFAEETNIPCYQFDVSDFNETKCSIDTIQEKHGAIDILVNNAGITKDATLHKMPPEKFTAVIETNLIGVYNTCRIVIEGMRNRGFGRIVNISSVNGLAGQFGQTNYAASKAGIIGFTKSLALENAAKGITVNVVAPGYTDTEMVRAVPENVLQTIIASIPVGRLGRPEEIARTVEFLCSEDSGFITGSTISINGGQYLA